MLTELQATYLGNSSANGGRFVNGKILVSLRKLEALGLATIEDNGPMRGRGMNGERWLLKATLAGLEVVAFLKCRYRASGSGERVTLASLHTRQLLVRRIWKESKTAAARGDYSSPAHEYQAGALVMQVARELYPSLPAEAIK